MRHSRLLSPKLLAASLLLVFLVSCGLQPSQTLLRPTATQDSIQKDAPLKWKDPAWLRNFPSQARAALAFDHLSLQEGLSQSVVTAIAQDPRGFLWFGTQDGLNRFDGYNFRIFKHDIDEPGSLIDNLITDLVIDSNGTLWVATNGGLDRYDHRTEKFKHFLHTPDDPNSLSTTPITSLAASPDGYLWVGTVLGLNRIDITTNEILRYQNDPDIADSLIGNAIADIVVEPDGSVWVATGAGLDLLDPINESFSHYIPDPSDPDSLLGLGVNALEIGRGGILWVATPAALNRLDKSAGIFKHYINDPDDPESLAPNVINAIFEDSEGTLWLGTNGAGLSRLEPETRRFIHYVHDPLNPKSLVLDFVQSIFQDSSGIMWFGTFGGGVDRYDKAKAKFNLITSQSSNPQSLSDPLIWSMMIDSQDWLWIGTLGGGVNVARPGSTGFQHYRSDATDPSTLSNDQIWDVFEDNQGTVWIGTAVGLDRFDRSTRQFTRYNVPAVFTMIDAKDGIFWLGMLGGGLSKMDRETGQLQTYTNIPDDSQSLSGNLITALLENDDGTIWVGTFANGLNLFNPSTEIFERVQHDPENPLSLPDNTILHLHRDKKGVLWIASAGGLSKMDSTSYEMHTYGIKHGLPNETVYSILEDDLGMLWIATNRGLTRFDPIEETSKNYDISDGLQDIEFNQGSAYLGPDGEMYFGGINGMNYFHPEDIRDNDFIPPVVITEFLLFNETVPVGDDSVLRQAVPETDEITLAHTDDFLAFEYAALHYSSPEENRYAYRMAGFDRGWNYVEDRRFASYTGIPPGDYTFEVVASNSDGVWNEVGDSIRIIIPRPFYQTWWFFSLIGLFVAGSVVGGLALRIRIIEGQRRELARQVEERTHELRIAKEAAEASNRAKSVFLTNVSHELRTPLNAIIGFSQLMIRTARLGRGGELTEEQRENLRMIQRSGEHLLGLINEVLELSKIEAGRATLQDSAFDLHRLLRGLEQMFRLRAEQKNLTLDFDMASEVPHYILADESKLRQILMNLLGNATKFTTEGGVALRVRMSDQAINLKRGEGEAVQLYFDVEDSGPGIPPEDQETIFMPFVQAEAGKQLTEGTGLGLSISQQFAQLMGGELTLQSQLGKGSVFILLLPVVVVDELEAPETEPKQVVSGLAPGQPTYRLLVVDDNSANRKLLVRLFEPLGFEVEEAGDGKQAIELWDSWAPHLIWMDMRMPGMDGYEATRRIKSTTKGQATVIIALTASALEEDREVILSEGCDDYVRKPFREEELFNTLHQYLGVTFTYEDVVHAVHEPSSIDFADVVGQLAELPSGWRDEMRQATLLGYANQIDTMINTLRPGMPEIAEHLQQLADSYDHQSILALLNQVEALE